MPNNPNAVANLKPCKKGQTNNPKGRPRKGASLILHTLKELGITSMTKGQIEDIYLQMTQLTQDELKKVFDDTSQPVVAQVVAKSLTGKNNFDVLEKMFDRGIGKPIQTTKSEVKVDDSSLTDEELKLVRDKLKENGLIRSNIR